MSARIDPKDWAEIRRFARAMRHVRLERVQVVVDAGDLAMFFDELDALKKEVEKLRKEKKT